MCYQIFLTICTEAYFGRGTNRLVPSCCGLMFRPDASKAVFTCTIYWGKKKCQTCYTENISYITDITITIHHQHHQYHHCHQLSSGTEVQNAWRKKFFFIIIDFLANIFLCIIPALWSSA